MNVLANGYYMLFDDFVNSYQTFNLKIFASNYQVFIRQFWKLILLSMKSRRHNTTQSINKSYIDSKKIIRTLHDQFYHFHDNIYLTAHAILIKV